MNNSAQRKNTYTITSHLGINFFFFISVLRFNGKDGWAPAIYLKKLDPTQALPRPHGYENVNLENEHVIPRKPQRQRKENEGRRKSAQQGGGGVGVGWGVLLCVPGTKGCVKLLKNMHQEQVSKWLIFYPFFAFRKSVEQDTTS